MPKFNLTLMLCLVLFKITIAQSNREKVIKLIEQSKIANDSSQFEKAIKLAKQANLLYASKNLDTLQIDINNKLAQAYLDSSKLDSCFYYSQQTVKDLTSELKSSRKYCKTLETLGIYYTEIGNYNKSIKYSKKALEVKIKVLGEKHESTIFQYDKIGRALTELGRYSEAVKYFQKLIDISESLDKFPKVRLIAYGGISYAFNKLQKYELAIEYCEKSKDLAIVLEGPNSYYVAGAYFNLAIINGNIRNSDKALEYHKKFEEVFIALGKANHVNIASNYFNIGRVYSSRKEFYTALNYFKKALNLYQLNFGDKHHLVGRCYAEIGSLHIILKQFKQGCTALLNAKTIVTNTNGQKNIIYTTIIESLGYSYFKQKKYKEAITYFETALDIYKKLKNDQIEVDYLSRISYCNNILGKVYYEKKDYHKAISCHSNNFKLGRPNKKVYHYIISDFYIANNLMKLGDLDNAYKHLKKLQTSINYNELSSSLDDNTLKLSDYIYYYLTAKGNYYNLKLEETKNSAYSDSIKIVNQKNLELHQYSQKELIITSDKTRLLEETLHVYESSINHFIDIGDENDLKSAFQISEETKSRQLRNYLNRSKAYKFGIVPDSLLTKERILSQNIIHWNKKLFESKNDSIQKDIKNKLFLLKRDKEELFRLFKNKYPSYHQLKHDLSVVDIKTIQEHLALDETLIEYFVGQKTISLFLISKNNFQVKKLDKPVDLENYVTQLRNSIYHYEEEATEFTQAAYFLYEKLLSPIKEKLTKKLVIIPDDVLHYIPFEALITKSIDKFDSYKHLPYLIKNHQISYSYSATLREQLLAKTTVTAKHDLITFAPEFKHNDLKFSSTMERRNGFENLFFNIPEAESIHNLIPGRLFKGSSATEENFLNNTSDYKIIHLATHAKSNDKLGDYSFIALSKVNDSILDKNRLYVGELYNLNLNADMVVLSACETGLGELQKGEGIISLARAFTYAGAKSTINSLWSVNDASTKTLMEYFYQNIKNGKSKDEALRDAKLTYLENENYDPPYFWASFIAMGNMEPIALSSEFNYWWLLLLPVVFGIIYFVKRLQ